MREAAEDTMLALYALSLVDTLQAIDVLNQKQAEELRAYLSSRLLPRAKDGTE